MTMLERGVCILPEWLANEFIKKMPVKKSLATKSTKLYWASVSI
jgi:hypothetical protein